MKEIFLIIPESDTAEGTGPILFYNDGTFTVSHKEYASSYWKIEEGCVFIRHNASDFWFNMSKAHLNESTDKRIVDALLLEHSIRSIIESDTLE